MTEKKHPANKYFKFVEDEAKLDAEFDEEIRTRLPELTAEAAAYYFDKKEGSEYVNRRLSRLFHALYVRITPLGGCKVRDCPNNGTVSLAGYTLCDTHHKKLLES